MTADQLISLSHMGQTPGQAGEAPLQPRFPGDLGLLSTKPGTSGPRMPAPFMASRAISVGGLQCNHSLIALQLLVQRRSTLRDVDRQEARETSGFVNN